MIISKTSLHTDRLELILKVIPEVPPEGQDEIEERFYKETGWLLRLEAPRPPSAVIPPPGPLRKGQLTLLTDLVAKYGLNTLELAKLSGGKELANLNSEEAGLLTARLLQQLRKGG